MARFVFLMCSDRSGGNILTSLLHSQSGISSPPPTHLFRLFGTGIGARGDCSSNGAWEAMAQEVLQQFQRRAGGWNIRVTGDELKKNVRRRTSAELLKFLYEKEAREEGASHILVRENQVYRFAPYLLAHFPDALFVYLIRDPRDVIAAGIGEDGGKDGWKKALDVWIAENQRTVDLYHQLSGTGKCHRLRYEDLLADKDSCLIELTAFMGLLYEETLRPFDQKLQTEKNGDRVRVRVTLNDPLIGPALGAGMVGKYKDTLSEAARRFIEGRCFALMKEFGYAPDFVNEATGPEDPDRIVVES